MPKLSMKKRSLVILAIVIFGVLALSVGIFLIIKNRANYRPGINSSEYEYIKIEVKSLDKSTSYGYLWVENGLIKNDINITEISGYVSLNSTKWQSESLEYPIGDYDNGTFWDGTQTTDITKSDFLCAIYVALDDEFGKYYYIDLIEKVLP